MIKKRILIVDDEVELVELMSMRLKASGYEVLALHDGENVLKKMRAERPDLIILDIMLPKVDGYKICVSLKEDAEFGKIPVILLTAKDLAREADQIQASRADACLTKPFESKQLLAKIRELIKKSAQD